MFEIERPYLPAGDQPQAIERLSDEIKNGEAFQTLLTL